MIHIVITDTDTGEIKFEKDIIALVAGMWTEDGDALGYAKNVGDTLSPIVLAVAAAKTVIDSVCADVPEIKEVIGKSFDVEGVEDNE